jgi:hypothetical protein
VAQKKFWDEKLKPNSKVFPHNILYLPFKEDLHILVFLFVLLALQPIAQLNVDQTIFYTHTHTHPKKQTTIKKKISFTFDLFFSHILANVSE